MMKSVTQKIEGVINTPAKEKLVTKAIARYARVHNEYARTVRQNTVLCGAAVREWNDEQDRKATKTA